MAKVTVRFKKVRSGDYIDMEIAPILDQFLTMPFEDLKMWFYGYTEPELKRWIDKLRTLKQTDYVPPVLTYDGTHTGMDYAETVTKFLGINQQRNEKTGKVYAPVKGFPMFVDPENNQSAHKTNELLWYEYEHENSWNNTSINHYITIEDATLDFGSSSSVHFVFKNCTLNIVAGANYNKKAELERGNKYIGCTFRKSKYFRSSLKLEIGETDDLDPSGFTEVANCTFDGLTFELPETGDRNAILLNGCTFKKCVFEKDYHTKRSDLSFVGCQLDDVTIKGISVLLKDTKGALSHSADWKDANGLREFEATRLCTIYAVGDVKPSIRLNENSFGARIVNMTKTPIDVKVDPRQTKYTDSGNRWMGKYDEFPFRLGIVGEVKVTGDPTPVGHFHIQCKVGTAKTRPDYSSSEGTAIDGIAEKGLHVWNSEKRDYDNVPDLENAKTDLIMGDDGFKLITPTYVLSNQTQNSGFSINGNEMEVTIRALLVEAFTKDKSLAKMATRLGKKGATTQYNRLFDMYRSMAVDKGLMKSSPANIERLTNIANGISKFVRLFNATK